ncbi:MAG TPA: hypothetical protein VFG30_41185 [Polyangiales bacterium]|nr:hypothetical protein [Polyangiales bacterium]
MTRLKALSVLQCREFVLETHGPDGIERVKAAMNQAARTAVYADELLPTDWIEVEYGVDHARAYDKVFGIGDGDAAAHMVSELTSRHATTLYKAVLVGSSPRTVIERSSRLWSRYYDQGETLVEFVGETTAIKRIVGCPDLPLYHDWLTSPYYAAVLRHSNARDVTVKHIKCVATGADCCETELRWKLDRGSGFPFDP